MTLKREVFLWLVVACSIGINVHQGIRLGRLEEAQQAQSTAAWEHQDAIWNHLTEWERRMYLERENRIGDLRKEFNKCIFTLSHPDGKLTNIIIWKPEHE